MSSGKKAQTRKRQAQLERDLFGPEPIQPRARLRKRPVVEETPDPSEAVPAAVAIFVEVFDEEPLMMTVCKELGIEASSGIDLLVESAPLYTMVSGEGFNVRASGLDHQKRAIRAARGLRHTV